MNSQVHKVQPQCWAFFIWTPIEGAMMPWIEDKFFSFPFQYIKVRGGIKFWGGEINCIYQVITSAGFHTASLIQLFSFWRSRRILSTNSYSCLSLLLVSHKQCRMNLIGPSEMLQDFKDQSDSFYISYVRQVARTNKNMNLLAEFSWIFRVKTAETMVQYETQHLWWPDLYVLYTWLWNRKKMVQLVIPWGVL